MDHGDSMMKIADALRGIARSVGVTGLVTAAGSASAGTFEFQSQPADQLVRAGQPAVFSVAAPGAFIYQWYVSARHAAGGYGPTTPIAGATGATLVTADIGAGDVGNRYSVTAMDGSGHTVTSKPAIVALAAASDGAPPAAFWGDIGAIPAAKQVMTFKFVNRTNGAATDAQVFWSVKGKTKAGQTIDELRSIAEAPTYDMPAINSARLYLFVAKSKAETGTGAKQYFDFIEFNLGRSSASVPYNFNGDTTRVDAFGLKLAFRLQCDNDRVFVRGEDYGTFLEPRPVTFLKYAASTSTDFARAAQTSAPYRIAEPGASGFGKTGPYATYFDAYIDKVYANNGIDQTIIPKPTPFLDLKKQLPDFSAALERHVADKPGTFKANGTLVDPQFWQKTPSSSFYAKEPANLYARYWHQHAIGGYQYGFPYDDVGGYSSDVSCNGPRTLVLAIGL